MFSNPCFHVLKSHPASCSHVSSSHFLMFSNPTQCHVLASLFSSHALESLFSNPSSHVHYLFSHTFMFSIPTQCHVLESLFSSHVLESLFSCCQIRLMFSCSRNSLRVIISNPAQSESRLSPAATVSNGVWSASTPFLHWASVLQPATLSHVVALKSWTISAPIMGWLRSVGLINYRSLLQNIVSFKGLFCKRPSLLQSVSTACYRDVRTVNTSDSLLFVVNATRTAT